MLVQLATQSRVLFLETNIMIQYVCNKLLYVYLAILAKSIKKMCPWGQDLLMLILTTSSRLCLSETGLRCPSRAWRGHTTTTGVVWCPTLICADHQLFTPPLAHVPGTFSARGNPVRRQMMP